MEQTASQHTGLDDLIRAVELRLPNAPVEAIRGLTRRLFTRGSADLLNGTEATGLAADVAALFELIDSVGADEIAVRVSWDSDEPTRGVLQTVMTDCPFIVDTIREYVHSIGIDTPHLLHPVVIVDRDGDGRAVGVRDRSGDGVPTSVVHLGLSGAHDEATRAAIEGAIRERLGHVRAVTGNFAAMLDSTTAVSAELDEKKREIPWRAAELEEVQELLKWMVDPGFVFLGYRSYTIEPDDAGEHWIQVDAGSGLGILRSDADSRYQTRRPVSEMSADLRARVLGGPLLIISKTNAESPIRRHARMDYIGIKKLRADGTVCGEHRYVGLFTAKAFSQDASTIPILRRKLREILQQEAAPRGSHDYNVILQTFNSMPKEELFLASVEEIRSVIEAVMQTEGADDVRVTARPDQLGRGVNVMVILPKNRFSGEVRRQLQAALIDAYHGRLLNYHLALGQGDQARLHFYLAHDPEESAAVDLAALESVVRATVRTWDERLEDALRETHGATKGRQLAQNLGRFSSGYQAGVDVETAVRDVGHLARLTETWESQASLRPAEGDRDDRFELRLFARKGEFVLSDVIPTLENLGLRVLDAFRFNVEVKDDASATIQIFEAEAAAVEMIDIAASEARIGDALRAIHRGAGEDDRLNELILTAELSWEQVQVLRAYAGYAFRIGAVASRLGGQRPLTTYPNIAKTLLELFEARFDPAVEATRDDESKRLARVFIDALSSVRGIEDDRTLRRIFALIQATERTNYYRAELRTSPLLTLKMNCRSVEFMPEPRPKHEVYLSGARTEAAHLRMDDVARGGIRWSDRYEDFRVEVLGLVKTQRVKNAVIVPGGAKGAFIAKRLPEEREARLEAGLDSYKEFIRGLLEISDNVVDGEVRHPERVVIHDGPDPYLVVAADKGTAKNSDTANELAAEAGYWLDDAFASGGSQGYDHKEEGITARGAWECVKRHFRELDIDYENEPFHAVGIGDMSGDVFGNGMLLSEQIALVAAFDHRHIFLDPDPDVATSWTERKRLFDLPMSSWADYTAELLSEGGGVFERTEKSIELSPQIRERLGTDQETVNGEELIRAILKAPVDLLWNGGIGTYVKASAETDADVGDPSNDGVRIDATEVRARVIGEGGNLGLTQRGRIELALTGVRVNTDAVDNSAGVDMSDHEVNLKILLGAAVSRGTLSQEARNDLLEACTDDVADAVLLNNDTQSLAISLDELRALESPRQFRDALQRLEREGILDPELEFLPSADELLERETAGTHLTRPELSILLAHSKLHLKQWISSSGVPQDPALMELVRGYFPPKAIAAVDDADLEEHRLRANITSTLLTNLYVDRMGATSHIQLMRESGRAASTVARTWYVSSRISDADELYARLRATDSTVRTGAQYQWYLEMSQSLGRATRWLLQRSDLAQPIGEAVDWLHGPVRDVRAALPSLLTGERLERFKSNCSLHEIDGLDSETAERLVTFRYVVELLPIASLIRETGADTRGVGSVYLGLAEEIDFPWLRSSIDSLSAQDHWERRAARILIARLEHARSRIAARILADATESTVEDAMERFRHRNAVDLSRIRNVIADIRATEDPTLSALVVAVDAVNDPRVSEPVA
ncbi:MAG: NAD-glutamate dehydrogenase [Gemmatimonadetes bacterium]|nr:NAD-glutamate dehydrogenase [Gemmatimonadota bacterium]